MRELLDAPGPIVVEVMTPREEPRAPSLSSMRKPDGSMVSKPLEDLWPFLPREEFLVEHDRGSYSRNRCAILIAGLGAIGQRHARNLRAVLDRISICWPTGGAD